MVARLPAYIGRGEFSQWFTGRLTDVTRAARRAGLERMGPIPQRSAARGEHFLD